MTGGASLLRMTGGASLLRMTRFHDRRLRMKGDISRETFDVAKHYSGVRMQQGRVQTDADWNEQEALQRRRTQIEARDVIGRCGAPEDNAGFAISISGAALKIGAGRYYVDGILCENETEGLAFE